MYKPYASFLTYEYIAKSLPQMGIINGTMDLRPYRLENAFLHTGFFDRDVFFKLLIFRPKNIDFPLVKSFLRGLLIIILKSKVIL